MGDRYEIKSHPTLAPHVLRVIDHDNAYTVGDIVVAYANLRTGDVGVTRGVHNRTQAGSVADPQHFVRKVIVNHGGEPSRLAGIARDLFHQVQAAAHYE